MINGINGWYFPQEVIDRANSNDDLLTLDFELGGKCPLRCIYCYRSQDPRDQDKNLIDFNLWKKVIEDASKIGLKSVKLIGGGEITLEKHFFEAMEFIADKGIITVLFTSGLVIGDDELCMKIHGIDGRQFSKKMLDLGMSVFIKVDSFNEELQDRLAGMKGFSKIRDKAIDILLDTGFNTYNPTRLGLEVNVSSYNYHEIMDIYSLRIKHNIYEDIVVSMPCEMYYLNKEYDISLEQKKELYKNIYNFNKRNNISFNKISPFIGGLICTQLGNGLYVTNKGNVYHCPGDFKKLGNIKEKSIIDIWKNFNDSFNYHTNYFCPFREKANILPSSFIDELRKEIL